MTSTLFRRATTVALLLGAIVITFVVVPTAALATDVVGLSDPGALVVHEGTIEVRENDTVIRDLEIRGTLRIEAENVRVCNVWVYTSAPWTIYVASGSAEFQNVEIGNPDVVGERGIGGSNLRATNIDIHSVEDGIKLGSNATYSHIWIHDLDSASDEPHIDAVQADGGAQNSSISHSVLSSVGPRWTRERGRVPQVRQGPDRERVHHQQPPQWRQLHERRPGWRRRRTPGHPIRRQSDRRRLPIRHFAASGRSHMGRQHLGIDRRARRTGDNERDGRVRCSRRDRTARADGRTLHL